MIIEARFNGPPGSGNGGYSAGLFTAQLPAGEFEITLRRPPPLDTPLSVDGFFLYGPERALIAEARSASVAVEPVRPVSPDEAAERSATYRGFTAHPFPTCYVCGPDRAAGDGLRIFPGPVGDGRTAAVWHVPPDVSPTTVWAALDCPGGWAIITEARPYVLGRIGAVVHAVPEPGTDCVVMGDIVGEEGRKAFVRTTLYDPAGTVLAHANATWIAL
jgi:hypothetical protein